MKNNNSNLKRILIFSFEKCEKRILNFKEYGNNGSHVYYSITFLYADSRTHL